MNRSNQKLKYELIINKQSKKLFSPDLKGCVLFNCNYKMDQIINYQPDLLVFYPKKSSSVSLLSRARVSHL